MAKLVTKFKYLKPSSRKGAGGYAKYIATREGVEKIDDTQKLSPATIQQKKTIEKIVRDFPNCTQMLEYDDYILQPNKGNASEFISRAIEDNTDEMMSSKTYADYIATRPRAERFGSHGLFTDEGVQVKLDKVSKELNLHEGNIWTAIVSLRREDAERLGFNTGARWRDMLRTQTQELSDQFHIPMSDLKWFAAFHNEGHHPHVHIIVYSENEKAGYLSQKGIERLRSSLAKEIFAQDLLSVYEKQTAHRNDLRSHSKELIVEIVSKINSGVYVNPALEKKLMLLAGKLANSSGKKQYGYLKADVKALVNSIVDDVAADSRIAELYDLWYRQREEIIRTYTDEMPKRIPLSQNTEFKSVRNAVVHEAMNILLNTDVIDDIADSSSPEEEPSADEADSEGVPSPSEKNYSPKMWGKYQLAKELLDKENAGYDPNRAVTLLIECANMGCGVAKYRLGKMFLSGIDVPKNTDYAMRWLEESASEHNQFSEYLLGKTLLNGIDIMRDAVRGEELLRRSASQHNKYAAYTLGKALYEGQLLTQNISEGVEFLRYSSDNGFAPAEYLYGKLLYRGEVIPQDITKAIDILEKASVKGNPFAAYLAGKIRLSEDAVKDIFKAIRNFEIAAENGNDFAEYQLGRIYLYGNGTERDYEKALAYLSAAAEHGNVYAAQLLHSIKNNRNWSATTGAIRLLHHISRILQNRLEDERKGKGADIDRKLRRKIDEKKQAHGLKQG